RLSAGLRRRAAEWDRYATSEVSDLPRVHGGERAAAAEHVAKALAAWRERPEGAGDLAFWRQRREGFRSPAAFVQVIEAPSRQPAGPGALFPLEFDADRLTDRLHFLAAVARMWRVASEFPATDADWQEALSGWLATARGHREQLVLLLDAIFEQTVPEPLGGF